MDNAEIGKKTIDEKGMQWTTTKVDPAGKYELQTNGNGEVKRVELSPPDNASIAAANAVTGDQMAAMVKSYKETGVVPAGVARGGPVFAGKFYGAVAADAAANGEQDSPRAIMANKMSIQANGQALSQTQKQLSATTSYMGTMNANIDKARELGNKLDLSDLTAVDKAYGLWAKGTSDPTMAKYNVFFDAVTNEYAKIKSGALGNTAVSDPARAEARAIIQPLLGNGGMNAVLDAIKQEGDNRVNNLTYQRDDLVARLQGKPGTDTSQQPGSPGYRPVGSPAAPAPAAGPKPISFNDLPHG